MYRIDTGQARTDLYGIGKGKAQVVDLTPTFEKAKEAVRAKAVVKAAEDKAAQDHMDDIMENIGKANRVAYMPKDAQLIADKTQAVTDYVEKNIGALKKGDIQATMGYQKLAGDLYSFAEQSKNFREKWEAEGTGISKDKDAYRPESRAAYLNMASTATAGQHDFDPTIFKKNVNYGDRVLGDLSQYAERAAQSTPYKKEFTLDQAETVIADDLKDAKRYEQAVYDFDNATDKLGAANAIDYYKKVYAPKLVIGDTKAGPRGSSYGSGGEKAPAVSSEYKITGPNSGVLVWDYIKPPDNPYQTFSVGSLRPGVIHNENGSLWMEGFTLPDKDGDSEMRRIPDGETRDFLQTKLLTNIKDLRAGKAPSNFEHKVSDFQKAAAAGRAAAEKTRAETEANKAENRVKVTTIEQYNALPKGTKYIDSKGNKSTKK